MSDARWCRGARRRIYAGDVGAVLLSPFLRQQLRSLAAVERREDLLFLKDLIEAGKLTPVIDRTYPLNEAQLALSDANDGHGRGKPVITL